jgi:hypothetical protein
MNCEALGPRLNAVTERLTPGAAFTLNGSCFGARGEIELSGAFAAHGNTLRLPAVRWSDSAVQIIVPMLSGVRDQTITVVVTRADGKRSLAQPLSFIAARTQVTVPADKWTPRASFEDERIAEASEVRLLPMLAPDIQPNAPATRQLEASVMISDACALEEVNATPRAGRVESIEGWDAPGPPHRGAVRVQVAPACATTVSSYAFGFYSRTSARQACRFAVDLSATASCPVGIAP